MKNAIKLYRIIPEVWASGRQNKYTIYKTPLNLATIIFLSTRKYVYKKKKKLNFHSCTFFYGKGYRGKKTLAKYKNTKPKTKIRNQKLEIAQTN